MPTIDHLVCLIMKPICIVFLAGMRQLYPWYWNWYKTGTRLVLPQVPSPNQAGIASDHTSLVGSLLLVLMPLSIPGTDLYTGPGPTLVHSSYLQTWVFQQFSSSAFCCCYSTFSLTAAATIPNGPHERNSADSFTWSSRIVGWKARNEFPNVRATCTHTFHLFRLLTLLQTHCTHSILFSCNFGLLVYEALPPYNSFEYKQELTRIYKSEVSVIMRDFSFLQLLLLQNQS